MADGIRGDRLAQIKQRAENATPGEWHAATAPAEGSSETKLEYLANTALDGDEPLWVVWAPNTSGDEFAYLVPAVTGDGPTSRANAEFIAHSREDVDWLISEVERLRAGSVVER